MKNSFVLDFVFTLILHRTCHIRGEPKVMGLGRTVYFLLWDSLVYSGSFLHKLWLLTKKVAYMSEVLAWGLLLS